MIIYDEVGRRRVPAAFDRIRRLRNAEQRIGFTNGCFDILHMGHVETFRRLAGQCDFVIVGVNSDESVRQLKGDGHPVIPDKQRAELISSLRWIDMVIVFNAPFPLDLIELIKPAVLAKGDEYGDGQIVGADFVKEHGGRVLRIPMVKDISSSKIIERIKQSC